MKAIETSLIDFLSEAHSRQRKNFSIFEKWIDGEKQSGDILRHLCLGLGKLTIVDIALDRAHDNPQLIFESMNSTGMALTQADLIRNFVLMGQKQDDQNRLYENYWRPMEKNFG